MFEIPRSLALRFRSICRRIGLRPSAGTHPSVYLDAGPDGLRIRAIARDAAVEYFYRGEFPRQSFSIPLASLAEAEGTTHQPIAFKPREGGGAILEWANGPIPQLLVADDLGRLPAEFPALPTNLTPNPAPVHTALRHAVAVADREATRYALNAIELDGEAGRIITTDGHQLLVQRGFVFPWPGNALIPASKVFDAAELAQDDPIAIGRSGDWVAFTFGQWVIYFKHDPDAKFPQVDALLGNPASAKSTLRLSDTDADFLQRSLDVMPAADSAERPVTIDLNGHVAVRSRTDPESTPTEVVLSNSHYTGDPLRTSCDRRFLGRALKFGFRNLSLNTRDTVLFCADDQRQYLWMPLAATADVPATEPVTRIASPLRSNRATSTPVSRRPRSMPKAATEPVNESVTDRATESATASPAVAETMSAETVPAETMATGRQRDRVARQGVASKSPPRTSAATPSTLDQAVLLRDALRVALDNSRELVRAIKRQKRQSRLVESTLQSLQELQAVA